MEGNNATDARLAELIKETYAEADAKCSKSWKPNDGFNCEKSKFMIRILSLKIPFFLQ